MDVLVGTNSVHATAAICDYLEGRSDAVDAVAVVAAAPEGAEATRRDGEEALNVATVRLGTVGTVETEFREGEFAAELLAAASERDVDEIVVGVPGAAPDREVGEGARALLSDATRPVVAVPVPDA